MTAFPALLAFALAPNLASAVASLAAWAFAFDLVILNGITVRQYVTPDNLQGRVNSTGRMVAWGGQPFGAAVGGVVAQLTSVRLALVLMAVVTASSAGLGWWSPLRTNPPRTGSTGSA